jgi:hypothetical protein
MSPCRPCTNAGVCVIPSIRHIRSTRTSGSMSICSSGLTMSWPPARWVHSRRYGISTGLFDPSVLNAGGDALAYQAWSFSTPDGRRQVTVAVTPGLNRDLDRIVEAFVDHAVCSGYAAQP